MPGIAGLRFGADPHPTMDRLRALNRGATTVREISIRHVVTVLVSRISAVLADLLYGSLASIHALAARLLTF